jgi:aspartate aminotransferase-like enzyme
VRPLNLLPGPVDVEPEVAAAFAAPAVSHRSPEAIGTLDRCRARLRDLTRAEEVFVIPGSGTLANDVVAAQLAKLEGPGLVLANGEFGERLADHARRAGLRFVEERIGWGEPFGEDLLMRVVEVVGPRWIWAVHCETSTGVLNDVDRLLGAARSCGAVLALDVISSLGAVPVDLRGVAWAAGSSAKALRAFPGLALVFAGAGAMAPMAPMAPIDSIGPTVAAPPRALDLTLWRAGAVGSTLSSNLVAALATALDLLRVEERFAAVSRAGTWVRSALARHGLAALVDEAEGSPAVLTIPLEPSVDAFRVGEMLAGEGLWVSYASGYLRRRNWIQICLFGDVEPAGREALLIEAARRIATCAAACQISTSDR